MRNLPCLSQLRLGAIEISEDRIAVAVRLCSFHALRCEGQAVLQPIVFTLEHHEVFEDGLGGAGGGLHRPVIGQFVDGL